MHLCRAIYMRDISAKVGKGKSEKIAGDIVRKLQGQVFRKESLPCIIFIHFLGLYKPLLTY